MNDSTQHILTRNVIGLKRAYLDEEVLPALSRLQADTSRTVRRYRIADKNVEISFHSPALEGRLGGALAHLSDSDADAPLHLSVHAWDLKGTSAVIAPPWASERYMSPQALDATRMSDDGFLGAYLFGEESVTIFDPVDRKAYFFVQDADLVPRWVDAAPFRTLWHWFLSAHDVHLLHGAAIAHNGRAVLLTARGGSGKSTTALSCVRSGMDYLGDDYVAVELGDNGARVHSLFSSAKVTMDTLGHFPELRAVLREPLNSEEKAIIDMNLAFPGQILRRAELITVLIPTIGAGESTSTEPMGPSQTLLALAPTSLFQLPLAANTKLRMFRRIVESVPSQRLSLGSDIAAVPDAVFKVLA